MADENALRRVPWMTILLIITCCAVYFAVQPSSRTLDQLLNPSIGSGSEEELRFIVDNAAIPCEVTQGRALTNREFRDTFVFGETSSCSHRDDGSGPHDPGKHIYLALLLSLFLHGSPQHLFGNMLFLWVFGNNIEDRKGWWRYLALYLAAGIVATFSHVLVDPNSTVPVIGASGAIAGVMGAYLVCYPAARVKSIIFFGPLLFRKVRASWLLVIWFGEQFLVQGSNVAWAAHVGGFTFGALVGVWWRISDAAGDARAPATARDQAARAGAAGGDLTARQARQPDRQPARRPPNSPERPPAAARTLAHISAAIRGTGGCGTRSSNGPTARSPACHAIDAAAQADCASSARCASTASGAANLGGSGSGPPAAAGGSLGGSEGRGGGARFGPVPATRRRRTTGSGSGSGAGSGSGRGSGSAGSSAAGADGAAGAGSAGSSAASSGASSTRGPGSGSGCGTGAAGTSPCAGLSSTGEVSLGVVGGGYPASAGSRGTTGDHGGGTPSTARAGPAITCGAGTITGGSAGAGSTVPGSTVAGATGVIAAARQEMRGGSGMGSTGTGRNGSRGPAAEPFIGSRCSLPVVAWAVHRTAFGCGNAVNTPG